jgi:hypothetical protein
MKDWLASSIQVSFDRDPVSAIANIMFRIPVQVVLLIAVATSQIFGGISCCCLGRTFASAIASNGQSEVSASDSTASAPAPTTKQLGRCPKCNGRKSAASEIKQTAACKPSNSQPSVNEEHDCQCVKLVLNGPGPDDLNSVSFKATKCLDSNVDAHPKLSLPCCVLSKFEVPVRFGGHSWQSVACVWRN